jgi:Flp pilus assembly protein TadD
LTWAGDHRAQAQRLYAHGVLCQRQSRLADAIKAWGEALTFDPLHTDARYNLAVGLSESGDLARAEKVYSDLLSIRPDHLQALYNLANMRVRQGERDLAEPLYRRLLAIAPTFANGWINLAMARSIDGDLVEAESCLRRAIDLQPANVAAHCNLAHLLLATRRWPEAWSEYEWRLRRPECPAPPVAAPDWQAGDAGARRVLLWNDQGLGDALQFMRYVPFLVERGHEVWLFVQDAIKALALSIPGVTGAVGVCDPLPAVDAQAPLLSLPLRLGLPDPATSWRGAYIKAARSFSLPPKAGRRTVGLAWRGNPAHPNRSLRDIALVELKPLFDIEGIDWLSLQVGAGAAEIAAAGLEGRITDLSSSLRDFADTAAAVAALDMIISIDTSVAHLVGAMGKPGWVMISTAREWRWAGSGSESLWYPSLRLFRQRKAEDWSEVVCAMAAALGSLNGQHQLCITSSA